jgi:hypothetical protein
MVPPRSENRFARWEAEPPTSMSTFLIVISPRQSELYAYLRRDFSLDPRVRVVLDRRAADPSPDPQLHGVPRLRHGPTGQWVRSYRRSGIVNVNVDPESHPACD